MSVQRAVIGIASALTVCLAWAAASFTPSLQPFGYIAPAAFSGTDTSAAPVAYLPKFEYGAYTGDIVAAGVTPSGDIDLLSPLWKASAVLATQHWDTGRFIVTVDLDGAVVPFRRDDLSGAQEDLLKKDEDKRIRYLRGDRSEDGNKFRQRAGVLGDIIHSNPIYVGKPPRTYASDNHADFVATHASRPGRIYVGANDGMLHAFDAQTGVETFAYVPSMLIPKLKAYTEPGYVHDYFVDGPQTVGDAYFSGAWSTVLVGTLGAGGKGVYALDVTSAAPISDESNASHGAGSRVLWEFSPQSAGGGNLGYTYARPTIAKMTTGQWAVVIGNGYLSASGVASLLVIDISTGTVLRELPVPDMQANGLSSPAVVDLNGDGMVDRAYAGDLNGNLWAFDLSAENKNAWSVALSGTPLFVATDSAGTPQAFTSGVEVARHPTGGVMVYAATGRLLADADGDDLTEQAVYGIWDAPPTHDHVPVSHEHLLAQSMTELQHASGARVRAATAHVPDWAVHRGWRLSLDTVGGYPGERVIQDMSLSNGRISISSMNPWIESGENWLLQINAMTGGAPGQIAFDLNGDGEYTVGDNVDGDGNGEITLDAADRVAGIYKGFGLASRAIEARIDRFSDVAITNQLAGTNPIHSDPTGGLDGDPAPGDEDFGLAGGHMDLDVSSQTYPINNGTTDKHDHEWDNEWGTVVDFFEIDVMGGFRSVDQATDLPGSDGNRRFIINVANAGLSPGAILEINGVDFPIIEWQAKVKRFLTNTLRPGEYFPVFKLSEPTAAEAANRILRLTSFKMKFASNALTVGGLHPTATGCVRGNDPSPNGEYRNGALTTQLLDASGLGYADGAASPASVTHIPVATRYSAGSFAIHDALNYAMPPVSKTHGPDDGLFWESTLFWHWGGGCYSVGDEDKYEQAWFEEVGTEDRRTHDGVPTGDYQDPYAEPQPEPGPDPDAPGGDPIIEREEHTEHSVSSDRVSSVGGSGRLFWREWVPDNL